MSGTRRKPQNGTHALRVVTTAELAERNEISANAARRALVWAQRQGYAQEIECDVWRATPALLESEVGARCERSSAFADDDDKPIEGRRKLADAGHKA